MIPALQPPDFIFDGLQQVATSLYGTVILFAPALANIQILIGVRYQMYIEREF
jgi:hypothetical protein